MKNKIKFINLPYCDNINGSDDDDDDADATDDDDGADVSEDGQRGPIEYHTIFADAPFSFVVNLIWCAWAEHGPLCLSFPINIIAAAGRTLRRPMDDLFYY